MTRPTQFVTPFGKVAEVIGALYAGGFGLWLWHGAIAPGFDPILWAGVDPDVQIGYAIAFVMAAFVHSEGLQINGKYADRPYLSALSPALRLAGMMVHFGLFLALTMHAGLADGGYAYAWATLIMAFGCVRAGKALTASRAWGLAWNTR